MVFNLIRACPSRRLGVVVMGNATRYDIDAVASPDEDTVVPPVGRSELDSVGGARSATRRDGLSRRRLSRSFPAELHGDP